MEGCQQRVVDEKTELDDKLSRLGPFVKESVKFTELPLAEQDRMERQFHLMTEYSAVLAERIAAFPQN